MAAADYYLCDVCDGKTFYDAHVQYENWDTGRVNFKPNGKPIPVNVGDMIVLCGDCAKTHRIVLETTPETSTIPPLPPEEDDEKH